MEFSRELLPQSPTLAVCVISFLFFRKYWQAKEKRVVKAGNNF